MQRPATSGGVCKHCQGKGYVTVKTAAGLEQRRCPACGGPGRHSDYRTK